MVALLPYKNLLLATRLRLDISPRWHSTGSQAATFICQAYASSRMPDQCDWALMLMMQP